MFGYVIRDWDLYASHFRARRRHIVRGLPLCCECGNFSLCTTYLGEVDLLLSDDAGAMNATAGFSTQSYPKGYSNALTIMFNWIRKIS